MKLESLIAADAQVTVTHVNIPGLQPKPEAIELRQAGIEFVQDHTALSGEYDIALDCAGQIPSIEQVSIKRGAVELTQTGGNKYK